MHSVNFPSLSAENLQILDTAPPTPSLSPPPASISTEPAPQSLLYAQASTSNQRQSALRNMDMAEIKKIGLPLSIASEWIGRSSYRRLLEIDSNSTQNPNVWGASGTIVQTRTGESRVLTKSETDVTDETPLADRPGLKELKLLSEQNITRLVNELGKLNENERAFLTEFYSLPLFATHATDAELPQEKHPLDEQGEHGDVVRIFSRKNLQSRDLEFPVDHSQNHDIKALRNDDFIFFSVEIGTTPKKPESRFGRSMYRFNVEENHLLSNASWMSLNDMATGEARRPKRIEDKLSGEDSQYLDWRETGNKELVFQGSKMKPGIALAVLATIRHLDNDTQSKLLAARGEAEMDTLVNSLFRPEIKCPHEFVGQVSRSS